MKNIDNITDDDREFLEKYQRVKRALRQFFKEEKLTEVIIELINKSECIYFQQARSIKYIDYADPTFNVSINWNKSIVKYPSKFKKDDEVGDWKIQVLRSEILHEYMEIMTKAIFSGDTAILQDIPYEEEIKYFILVNIFQIHVTNDRDADSKITFRVNI